MEEIRQVKRVVEGTRTQDGAGVKLVRVFARREVEDFDPFLMLDAFDSTDPDDYTKGFPWHPHRGIETITYIISGNIEHEDNLGNRGVISHGECQWMTAGSGIIHQEMPKPSERMLGAQVWLNLPAADKMTEPQYRDVTAGLIPIVSEAEADIKIISGTYKGHHGGTHADYIKPLFLDVNMRSNKTWRLETDPETTLFIYIFSGKAQFENDKIYDSHRAILFEQGKSFQISSGDERLRFLLLMARALKEPVAWEGSIVMNSQKELDQAFKELEAGTFIR